MRHGVGYRSGTKVRGKAPWTDLLSEASVLRDKPDCSVESSANEAHFPKPLEQLPSFTSTDMATSASTICSCVQKPFREHLLGTRSALSNSAVSIW